MTRRTYFFAEIAGAVFLGLCLALLLILLALSVAEQPPRKMQEQRPQPLSYSALRHDAVPVMTTADVPSCEVIP